MTPENANQVTVALLMLSLISVLAVAIFASFLGLIYVRRRGSLRLEIPPPPSRTDPSPARYRPNVFENACRWIVIKGGPVSAVQSALGLHNPVPCSWEEGLSHLTPQKLFISPPVRGWIVVIGPGLPDPSEDVDRCFHLLMIMNRSIGPVQFFSFNRALNHHAWAWAEAGQIRRAYCWAGETLWNQGEQTPAEDELGLRCVGYGEVPEPADFGADDPGLSTAEKVLALAGRWSIDPAAIDQGALKLNQGITGDVVPFKLH